MENKNKIILDLCGGTGAWSKPYFEAGYPVINATLPFCDVTETLFDDSNRLLYLRDAKHTLFARVNYDDVHGILCAPPCTEFSLAKHNLPRDFKEGMRIVEACLQLVWHIRIAGGKDFTWWALENPRGFLRQFLGKPAFHFEAWWFGDQIKKPTDLWGYFTAPERTHGELLRPAYPRKGKESWASRNAPGAKRSVTPAGFAKAFFEANP